VERIPQDGRHYGPSGRLPAYAHEDAVR
jgi:hypothetical protein